MRRVRCKECGRTFSTQNRRFLYCSDPCRKLARARTHRRADRARASRGRAREKKDLECRVCGRRFAPVQGHRGNHPSYCSDACRSEGMRAKCREHARKYLADPERRAIHAARNRASHAARRRRLCMEEEGGSGGGG